ncbi:MAG: trehalose utilization protein ThuA [Clostridiaceae bacterium]|nr:trehalose utilization protein ThuA [Clostridiaceae bacterium]
MIKVTVWNEFIHENANEHVRSIYPEGIHNEIAKFLSKNDDIQVRTATLKEPNHGLDDEILDDTDVLIWWGHIAHHEVSDEIVAKIHERVLKGMGFIALHSAHYSKPFIKLMGTSCSLRWRDDDRERLWCVNPGHPIARGVPEYIEIPNEEMYGEFFDIPTPDELVFIGWFRGGEVFRSGCVFNRGYGKVFYFQPGHETHPIYKDENIQKIITNAVYYLSPVNRRERIAADCTKAPEEDL